MCCGLAVTLQSVFLQFFGKATKVNFPLHSSSPVSGYCGENIIIKSRQACTCESLFSIQTRSEKQKSIVARSTRVCPIGWLDKETISSYILEIEVFKIPKQTFEREKIGIFSYER